MTEITYIYTWKKKLDRFHRNSIRHTVKLVVFPSYLSSLMNRPLVLQHIQRFQKKCPQSINNWHSIENQKKSDQFPWRIFMQKIKNMRSQSIYNTRHPTQMSGSNAKITSSVFIWSYLCSLFYCCAHDLNACTFAFYYKAQEFLFQNRVNNSFWLRT